MIIMNFMQLLIVTSVALTASARISSSRLRTRAFTGPSCQADFQWTENEQHTSPCILAAIVIGSCTGPDFTVTPLKDGEGYNNPLETATLCSCSWAAYNLLMACTACQGDEKDITTWTTYSLNCTGKLLNTYFPSNQTLAGGIGIPVYAVTNPTTWPEERFDVKEAEDIANQGKHDVVQSSSHKSSSPVGAIVGGVIGGLAVVSLAGGLAFYLIRRKKRNQSSRTHFDTDGSKHARKMSDLSQKSSGIGIGYQQIERSFATSPTSQPPLSPTTGTMHTHSTSVNSLSFFGSVRHSVNPYGTSTSPSHATQAMPSAMLSPSHPSNTQEVGPEGIISPFILPPSDMTSLQGSSTNLSDRKRADGAIIPVYDPPYSLPHNVAPPPSETSTTRTRLNPPAYSDVDEASTVQTRTHQKKDSSDTQFSTDFKPGSVVQKHSGAGGDTISPIEEVIGQMGLSGQESISAGGTLSTGQSGQLLNVRPFRPVLGNPDP